MKNWKKIKDFENYLISDEGEIINSRGLILKPYKTNRGYLRVDLCKNGKAYHKSVHRLVLEAFSDRIPGKEYINHRDLNKENNHLNNLEWCTAKENSQHALKNGKYFSYKDSPNRILGEEEVKIIPKLIELGGSARSIGYSLGVSKTTILNILSGMVWNTLGIQFPKLKRRQVGRIFTRSEIRNLIQDNTEIN